MEYIGDTLRALWELVAEGSMTRAEAVRYFREETNKSLTECMHMGVLTYFQHALDEHD